MYAIVALGRVVSVCQIEIVLSGFRMVSTHSACKKEDEVHLEVDAHGKSVSKNNGSSRKRNLLHFRTNSTVSEHN